MFDRLQPSVRSLHRRLSATLVSTAILSVPAMSLAHNVETDGDVGATFHLEPDHNPKSGEAATVWFALTRDGGESIPLSDCDCTLSIVNTQDEDKTIEAPELTAIDVETYTDIPSAEVTFPEPGIYAVKLSGQASTTATEAFEAFELSYEVTVSPGTAKDGTEKPVAKTDKPDPSAKDSEKNKANSSKETKETEGAETSGKMQRNPVVDSWVWLIISLLMLGAGGGLGSILLGRAILNRLEQRRGRSLHQTQPLEKQAPSSAPTVEATATTMTHSTIAPKSVTSEAETAASELATSELATSETEIPDTATPETSTPETSTSETSTSETSGDTSSDNPPSSPAVPATAEAAEQPIEASEVSETETAKTETTKTETAPTEEIPKTSDTNTTSATTSAIVTEAVPALESNQDSDRSNSSDPEDAIAAIKDWD